MEITNMEGFETLEYTFIRWAISIIRNGLALLGLGTLILLTIKSCGGSYES
jgi:hypothetical protein